MWSWGQLAFPEFLRQAFPEHTSQEGKYETRTLVGTLCSGHLQQATVRMRLVECIGAKIINCHEGHDSRHRDVGKKLTVQSKRLHYIRGRH